ncbi:hypothetical protein D3C86_1803570 [compost metagenome]
MLSLDTLLGTNIAGEFRHHLCWIKDVVTKRVDERKNQCMLGGLFSLGMFKLIWYTGSKSA